MTPIVPLALAGLVLFGLSSSSKPAKSQPRLRNWSGKVGQLAFNVKAMGGGWAWYVESIGSGSESTAKLALQQALRAAVESDKIDRSAGWVLQNDLDTVLAQVWWNAGSDAEHLWTWNVSSDAGNFAEGPAGSRGVATLQALDTLEPFTDGSA